MPIQPVSVLVNDRPRPPSRQEVLQMQYIRSSVVQWPSLFIVRVAFKKCLIRF